VRRKEEKESGEKKEEVKRKIKELEK